MKVALVHDYIKEYGGAERVLEELHELFPDAPIYTSVYLPEYLGPHKERFKSWDIRTSFANHLPFRQKLISPLRLISPFLFRSFNFSYYDFIIVSATGAYFPNTLRKKKAKLLCYCHTPPRYLYGYATAREWRKNKILSVIGAVTNHFLRLVDYRSSQNVDQFIANSEEVKARIKKFYRKEAVVVYPPVVSAESKEQRAKGRREYYVTGGRLARAKHNEIPIRACLELGVPLKVFGKGFAGYEEELKALAKGKPAYRQAGRHSVKSLIEFVGEVSDEEKGELLRGAKALLYASEDEDFGIIPVEAMSAGTPVIAYKSGGVQETVVDGKTGVFFNELSAESMKEAIKKFEKKIWSPEDCQHQAEKFSAEKFKREIMRIVRADMN